MAPPTLWTWVWASSGRWWRTGKPAVLTKVLKQSQEASFPPQDLQIISWAISHDCLIDTESPIRGRKLTTWWADYRHDISCHNSEKWPQGNGSKPAPYWRLTVLKTVKTTLIRPLMTSFKTARADCAVSACSPLPTPLKHPLKSSCPLIPGSGSRSSHSLAPVSTPLTLSGPVVLPHPFSLCGCQAQK